MCGACKKNNENFGNNYCLKLLLAMNIKYFYIHTMSLCLFSEENITSEYMLAVIRFGKHAHINFMPDTHCSHSAK